MLSYTVTIGRNVGTEPMSTQRWEEFQATVLAELEYRFSAYQPGAYTIEEHTGYGYWESGREESHKITALVEEALGLDHLEYLRRDLAAVAGQFDQDAIAFTIGMSHLIEKVTRTNFHTYGEDHQFTAADLRD